MLRETTSQGLCGLVCPSRTGTREEPGTLIQGAPVFPGSSRLGISRLGIEPKTPGWLVQDPTTRPIGDLIPTIGGSGAHPWRGVCQQRSQHKSKVRKVSRVAPPPLTSSSSSSSPLSSKGGEVAQVRHDACRWNLETCRDCAGPPGPDLAKRDLNPRIPV